MKGYTSSYSSQEVGETDVRGLHGETPEEYLHIEGDFDYTLPEERDNLQRRLAGITDEILLQDKVDLSELEKEMWNE